MYSKAQLLSMNRDPKYASSPWIKNVDNLDPNKLYTLYATNNASLSSGRQYVALNKLTNYDYITYNIIK